MPYEQMDRSSTPKCEAPSMMTDLLLEQSAILFRRQAYRWRHTQGAYKPSELWGLLQVPHEEIDGLLSSGLVRQSEDPLGLKHDLSIIEADLMNVAARIKAFESAQLGQGSEQDEESDSLCILQRRFQLNSLDIIIVSLLHLTELDARYKRLTGYILDDATRTRPTIELLCDILEPLESAHEVVRQRFMPDAPLMRYALILNDGAIASRAVNAASSIQLPERIVSFLSGAHFAVPVTGQRILAHEKKYSLDELILAPVFLKTLKDFSLACSSTVDLRNAVVFLHGDYGTQKRAIAQAVSASINISTIQVESPELLHRPDLGSILKLLFREAILTNSSVVFCNAESFLEPDSPGENVKNLILDWIELAGVPTWLLSDQPWVPCDRFQDRRFVRLDQLPSTLELRTSWWMIEMKTLYGKTMKLEDQKQAATMLATAFQLDLGRIQDAIVLAKSDAVARNPLEPDVTVQHLYEGCRRQSGERLGALAKRVEPTGEMGFESLILSTGAQCQIDELRRRIRLCHRVYGELGFDHRLMLGKGTIALFTGGPGTGKTMTARLLAKEQGVDIYQVDLSCVVSKYVGDTEKNLSRIFDEAQDTNAILFFDEADSLFGKRGEVKDARDRWANMEINYLLQRVEEYEGTVILSTNLRQNIDAAFLRRIHIIVNFPFPDAKAREQIWRSMFPKDMPPLEDTFLADIAERFPLAGGSIRNIMVDAAFRSLDDADDDPQAPVIGRDHILIALGREYLKMDKPITATEFGEEFYAVLEKDMLLGF